MKRTRPESNETDLELVFAPKVEEAIKKLGLIIQAKELAISLPPPVLQVLTDLAAAIRGNTSAIEAGNQVNLEGNAAINDLTNAVKELTIAVTPKTPPKATSVTITTETEPL